MEEWSNYACLGYAIQGAKEAGFTDEQIELLVRKMHVAFDFKTIEEAQDIYRKSPY